MAVYKEDIKEIKYYNTFLLNCRKNPRQQQKIAIRSFIFPPRNLPSITSSHSPTWDGTTWGRAAIDRCDEGRSPQQRHYNQKVE
jgi:hypothetical protein